MAIKQRNTGGQLFENSLSMLEVAGFQRVRWQDALSTIWDRVIIQHYPYKTIYGTRGRHEWAIKTPDHQVFIECKFQDVGGSVDEKMPYILETFKHSKPWKGLPLLKDWIVAFEGPYWKSGRGERAVEWMIERAAKFSSSRRSLVVARNIAELSVLLRNRFDIG